MEYSTTRLVILLSLFSLICASKPVLVRNNSTGQLYTSSLLTWENFNNDPNQLKHAVVGGIFDGEDVSSRIATRFQCNYAIISHFRKTRRMSVVRQSTRSRYRAT